MRTSLYSLQALGLAPGGLHERVTKSCKPNLPNEARRQGRQRRPLLTFSNSSNSNEKSSTSQNSLDTLDLLLNSADPSPGLLICYVCCKVTERFANLVMYSTLLTQPAVRVLQSVLHADVLPGAEDTFDETAGAPVAEILDPLHKQTRGATLNDTESAATARQQADASTR